MLRDFVLAIASVYVFTIIDMKQKLLIIAIILVCVLAVSSETAQLITVGVLWGTNLLLGLYLLIRYIIQKTKRK